jgi:hypothetical protein
LQCTKRYAFLRQRLPTFGNRSSREIRGRDYDRPSLRSKENSHHMLRNFRDSDWFFPPFHFNEIQVSIKFNYPIDLFNGSRAVWIDYLKRLAYSHTC